MPILTGHCQSNLAFTCPFVLYILLGFCSVNSPVDIRFVNSVPCLADEDGYLISNTNKMKGKLLIIGLTVVKGKIH